jgi:hypothetical protein
MNLYEFTQNIPMVEAQLVWARRGQSLTRKFRCAIGYRAGRVVSDPSQCFRAVDIKKRLTLQRTKARMGARMAKKAQRTKKFNPASKALRRLNR